jgi:plastocyanin
MILLASTLCAALPGMVMAADAPAPAGAPSGDVARLEAEIAQLKQELRDQRQLVLQLMQMQQALLQYLHGGGGSPPAGALSPVPPAGSAATPSPSDAAPARRATTETGGDSGPRVASITGRVRVTDASGETYVYVDGPRVVSSHAPTIEIKQEGRKFVPAVAVVPAGTHVLFPNRDMFFHNVFSNTPGDAFDVGTAKAGETPPPVRLLKPGHVEVFCNIHSSMRADVLVVPNNHWARVRPDGTFHIPGVPLGSYRIVLWGPNLKPSAEQVNVTADGATVTLSTEAAAARPHMNKHGSAYGSYEN